MVAQHLLWIAGLVSLSSLGGGAQPTPPGAHPAGAPVTAKLTSDKKVYKATDPVKLTFFIKNPSKQPVKMSFSSGMKYDFEIRKGKLPTGEAIWVWSHGRMFTMMFTNTTLDPGKSLTFTESFVPGEAGPDGKPGRALEPGVYTATGTLTLSGRTPRPRAQVTLTVK